MKCNKCNVVLALNDQQMIKRVSCLKIKFIVSLWDIIQVKIISAVV